MAEMGISEIDSFKVDGDNETRKVVFRHMGQVIAWSVANAFLESGLTFDRFLLKLLFLQFRLSKMISPLQNGQIKFVI